MHFEGLIANLHSFEELSLDVRHAGGGEQRGQHIFVRENIVADGAGLDYPGPADRRGYTKSSLPIRGFFITKRRCAAIRPTEFLSTIVSGIHHDRVVFDA